jgi:hypothetical protein
MTDTSWKAHERRTARRLGGTRTGPTGQDGPDVDAGWLVAECKHRRRLPAWLGDALAKVRGQAGPGRLGVVVAHEAGARDSWVILALSDWCDWYGPLPGTEEGRTPAGVAYVIRRQGV